eukprot:CAMPEP_0195506848 /NCGR_PEP_ID=MMETSP0794_2-20130614/399_1 /TAXON_ID=515487 /ORGANISM="Stephanopyxis turris, Strain CCMP 815" /LENGTH=918 /DNA_ID=CAMNT_0040633309 /DNA_START=408 /DNA_END=3164 /DNA_ORIENTATION=-
MELSSSRCPGKKRKKKRHLTCSYFSCGSNADGCLGLGDQTKALSTHFTPVTGDPFRLENRNTFDTSPPNSRSHSSCFSEGSSDESCIEFHDAIESIHCDYENLEKRKPQFGHERCDRKRSVSMSSGRAHTMCCIADGSLYAWGSTSHGQLGLGSDSISASSSDKGQGNVSKVKKAAPSSIAEPLATVFAPARVTFPYPDPIHSSSQFYSNHRLTSSVHVQNVACGSDHTLTVSSVGNLYSFGRNTYGNLGLGDTIDRNIPTLVTAFLSFSYEIPKSCGSDANINIEESYHTAGGLEGSEFIEESENRIIIVGAAGGLSHSLVLTLNGEVYSFGRGSEGQLGDGKFGAQGNVRCQTIQSTSSSDEMSIVDVGAFEMDEDESCFPSSQEKTSKECITRDREDEHHCQGEIPHHSPVPIKVGGMLEDNPVVMLSCSQGGHGSFAVTAVDGYGWHWGLIDKDAEFSFGEEVSNCKSPSYSAQKSKSLDFITPFPTSLPSPLGATPSDLTPPCASPILSGAASNPRRSDSISDPDCSGGTSTPTITQASKISLRKDRIIALSAGSHHLICVTRAGEAWAMGAPGAHLGLGPGCQFEWNHTAGRVLLPGDILINGVTCGERHTLLSTTSGRIFCCGDDSFGKLGFGGKPCDAQTTGESSSTKMGLHQDLDVASCRDNCIPRAVPLRLYRGEEKCKQGRNNESRSSSSTTSRKRSPVLCSTTVGEFTVACETVLQNLRNKHEAAERDRAAAVAAAAESQKHIGDDSFEDDKEDYWGEEGLGYELEMDFGFGKSGPPFGIEGSSSWKKRLSSETKRRLSNSTRAVGGAILSGSAVLSSMVSAVKSGMQSSSEEQSTSGCSGKEIEERRDRSNSGTNAAAKDSDSLVVGSVDSHQDSFDGLAGKARRRIMMVAGKDHSFIHIVDNID